MKTEARGVGNDVPRPHHTAARLIHDLVTDRSWLYLLRRALLLILLLPAATLLTPAPLRFATAATTATMGVHVQGNQLVTAAGQPLRLYGVNRAGSEYACVRGTGIFDGPSDAASVLAMLTWHINTVKIPLNEDCWLGINGVAPAYSGANYRQAIVAYVGLLNQYGLTAILDLHWSAPGTSVPHLQEPMPDQDHAPTFWTQVATTFKNNDSVLFDLFNEPYPDAAQDTTAAWQCWRDGGTCVGIPYHVAGMQELVTAVRSTGATNVILLGGVGFAGRLSRWLAYEPVDPTGNLAVSWHNENLYNLNPCLDAGCWESQISAVVQQAPVVPDEIGESDCGHWYLDQLTAWLDSQKLGYLAWTWTTGACYFTGNIFGASGQALISDYSGTPTNYGVSLRAHLAALVPVRPRAFVPPFAGAPGAQPVAIGDGFGAREPVMVYWDNPPQVLGVTQSDALGRFYGSTALTITVPLSATPGLHVIYAVGQVTRAVADGLFLVR